MKIGVKLDKDILTLKLDSERTFAEQLDDVKIYLDSMKTFLAQSDVRFAYDGALLSFEEEMELCAVADEAFGRQIDFCYQQSIPDYLMRHLTANGERLVRKIERTIQPNEAVISNGDLIVVGDVSPTAQVSAQGDIFVMGDLRGIAHAGYGGNEKAMIYAMNMNPVMLKIGSKIGFTNEESVGENGIALLENGEIKVKMI